MKITDNVATLKGVGPKKAEALSRAGIDTIEDLLYFFPRKYQDRRSETKMCDVKFNEESLIVGTVMTKNYDGNPYKKSKLLKLLITDETAVIEVVFFNGKYIADYFKEGSEYSFYGRITENPNRKQMVHPEFHKKGDSGDLRGILPVYGVIEGISQNEIRKLQLQAKEMIAELAEWLPEKTAEENRLCSSAFAIENMHFPKNGQAVLQGKFRLIFEELLIMQSGLMFMRNSKNTPGRGIRLEQDFGQEFIKNLPFALTKGQERTWEQIRADLLSSKAMNRLVQGDVGSGKTAIAEIAMYSCVRNGYQAVMMAPTELLAKQHFENLTNDFARYDIKVGLLCSSMKAAAKRETIEELAKGEIKILVGTHALIQPNVIFDNLGLVITDEQHRFGVNQRSLLTEKGQNVNSLVMTATPIPRTLAVILYGDLDISAIDTMPVGRKPIKTIAGNSLNRGKIYDFVASEVKKHRQAYIVAPLIEESENVDAASAQELFLEMQSRFRGSKVALIHGSMKQEEKDNTMAGFAAGNIDVLVSTVVIEVGINVANATVMVIENCERFGLAQLHQLRGRVGRGQEQSYCFLICGSETELAMKRSETLCKYSSGFDIAEEDLKLRGPGEMFGTRQHGLPELQMSDLVRHADILEKARDEARRILAEDPNLADNENQILRNKIEKMFGKDIKLQL